MNRRQLLTFVAASQGIGAQPFYAPPVQAQTPTDVSGLLRLGACALMLRHAQTESGVGDPPGYQLNQCSTQRSLSDEGREQARRIGQWFKANQLKPSSVQSSIWCRCKDTAELAFGHYQVLGALASTFDERSRQDGQTQALRARLKNMPAGQFEVWVTHQVNITAMTGEVPAMGEAVVVSSKGDLLGRTFFTR